MPFETGASAPKRIAVIGGGISGMGAAHALGERHAVTLFEAEPRLGGHARTVLAGKRGDQPVDVGFIVFNYANYPHLTALFETLGVPVAKSDMSFGASFEGGRIEYGLKNTDAVFAQRSNLLRPQFLRMVRDILRFNAKAEQMVGEDREITIGAFLERLGTGTWFRERYLMPFSGAIWSTPTERILDFPAYAMISFFRNHALMSRNNHQWWTVQGGSIEYVSRLEARMQAQGVDIRTHAPVAGVRRVPDGVHVRAQGGEWEHFDEAVLAAHSDDALALLEDPSPDERAALGAISYQPNEVVLHSDERLMPRRRKCWSSWNYTEISGKPSERIDLTYWMNSLQPIPQDDPLFVTLNNTRHIRQERIHHATTFRHPVYDAAALAAQGKVRRMNGTARTWFCGAWMKNGFHEDGLSSGIEVAQALGARDASAATAA